ncbi:hypothetical protein [Saccharolobus islandicus]|uniref:Uncharacterized protein n=1 Tax=Saccharolobus islandicus (strain M.16.4 / Kamchatka \|nr:hypothetical protein [Sulfolobus islandicus]ACR41596.1 hypothetical protein M164_0989 [Sulfolobus islandicus M.16.4]
MNKLVTISKRDVITALILYLISLAPIYVFLFSNGYLNFYGYNLPLFSGKEVEYLFTASVYNPEAGFSINDGIYFLLLIIFTTLGIYNIIIVDKIFLLIIFTAMFLLLWTMINMTINIFRINKYRNLLRIIGILFFILNPTYLECLGADFYGFVIGIIVFSYIQLKLIDITINNANITKYDILKSGIALGFSGLMDPRIFIWGSYVLILTFIIILITKRNFLLRTIKYLSLTYISSLPIVAYIYYLFIYPSLITQPSAIKAVAVPAYRPDTYSYIATWSGNSLLFNVFTFINSEWTSIVYAPPSILLYPRTQWWFLPHFGTNSLILLPPGIITYIWLASLYIFFIVVALALFDRKRTLASSLLFVPMFLIISLSAGTNVPIKEFIYLLEVDPSKLPIVGGIFATTFAIPYYAEAMALPFASYLSILGVNYLLNRINKEVLKKIAVGIIITLAVFASWQYFNGTLFPSQVTGSFPGNSISLEGYYYPLNPPPQWIHVMNILSTSTAGVAYVGEIGFSEKWTNYQFISYSPPLMPGYATISPPPTTYVNQTPLAYDIAGIKYLFIDNTSYIPLSNYFIYSYLNNAGLKAVYAKGDVYLLEQPNASVFRYAKEALSINTTNESIAFEVEDLLYPLLNYTPAIISPRGEVKVLVNPTQVTANYMAFFNESLNVSVSPSEYIILNGTRTERYLSGVIHVSPNTLIIPASINLSKLVSYPLNFSFNQLTASFTVNVKPGYIIETSLPLPNGGVIANGGKILGQNVFGQTVILSNSNTVTLSIKLGFFTNVLMTLVDIFYYFLFVYFIIYKGLRSSGITMVILNVISNGRFKGNK